MGVPGWHEERLQVIVHFTLIILTVFSRIYIAIVRMIMQVVSVVRMLLLLAGVESHPGPTIFRAFLVGKTIPQESLNVSSCSLICSDSTLDTMTSIFSQFLPWFKDLVLSTISSCSECPKVMLLVEI